MSANSLAGGTFVGPFKILRKLGEGAYGSVYLAEQGKNVHYALKVCSLHEPGGKKVKGAYPKSQGATLLFHEYNCYTNIFRWHPNLPVLPEGCYGEDAGAGYRWLALQELAHGTLASRVGEHHGVPLPTVAILALQLLDVLAHIHATGFVYCDLNLDNVLLGGAQPLRGMNAHYSGARTHMGTGGAGRPPRLISAGPPPPLHNPGERAYLVDMGMATEFVSHTGAAVGPGAQARGTPLFSSTSHAEGQPLSPRDDLQALCYLLAAAAGGIAALPWAAAASAEHTLALKRATTPERLAAGLPEAARKPCCAFFKAVFALKPQAAAATGVDYNYLKALWQPSAPAVGAFTWTKVPGVGSGGDGGGAGGGGGGGGGAGSGKKRSAVAAAPAVVVKEGGGARGKVGKKPPPTPPAAAATSKAERLLGASKKK
jgi:serine/threonine protein kinase